MNLLKGTMIITLGIIISRAIGLFFTFPFSNMVSSNGLSLYSYAYVIYAIFIDIATLGVPLGIAKVISIYQAKGQYKTVSSVFKYSMIIMVIISFLAFIIINILAGTYAKMVLSENTVNRKEDVVLVVRIISISLLVIPFVSILRGYFQGKNKMIPIALSQIIEQFVRVSFAIVACYLIIIVYHDGYKKAINYTVFAAFIAGVMALIVLLLFYFKDKKEKSLEEVRKKEVIKQIVIYAIPYALIGLNMAMYNLSDSMVFNRALNSSNSEMLYGIYAFEISKLLNIPVSLATGLAMNILPRVTYASVKEETQEKTKDIYTSYHTLFLIIIPIVILVYIFSSNIYSTLYSNYQYGGMVLKYSSPLILIFCFSLVTNSIMQGVNKNKKLLLSLGFGILLKVSFNYLYLELFGYLGAIILTGISFLMVITSNLFFLRKEINLMAIFRDFLNIILYSIIPTLFLYILSKNYYYESSDRLMNFYYIALNFLCYFLIYMFIIRNRIHKLIVG